MDYELKRYLSKFTALAAELREKKESDNKIIIRKNQVALEKAKKQTNSFHSFSWVMYMDQ